VSGLRERRLDVVRGCIGFIGLMELDLYGSGLGLVTGYSESFDELGLCGSRKLGSFSVILGSWSSLVGNGVFVGGKSGGARCRPHLLRSQHS
jgi:hypothetical protein